MENKKRAIILGVLGMDGSHLAELLHSKNYEIHGIVKENTTQDRIEWIKTLVPDIIIYPINILNKTKLIGIIDDVLPNEIYNFSGVSTIDNPFSDLDEILNLNARVPQHILEIIVAKDKKIKFFQASSCLVFGKDKSGLQNESTPRCPNYPYSVAKNYADNLISIFRETFGIFACSGILFPHISPRQSVNFYAKKVCSAIARIKAGNNEKLKLGDLSHMRDWSWSPDVVEAIYLMMQAETPQDYVIGSGVLTSAEYFARMAFEYAKLDYQEHIEYAKEFDRKKDMWALCSNNRKIKLELKWHPKTTIQDIAKKMVDYEIEKLKQ